MTATAVPSTRPQPDLMTLAFWVRPQAERLAAFARLRAEPEPAFFDIPKVPLFPSGTGAYALVTHADVTEASHRPKLFSNEPTANAMVDMPRWLAPYFGSMINMDDPRHAQIRRVVAQAFTPRTLENIEPDLQRRATRIVDDLIATGPRDFVEQVAARLPVEVICDLLGIPERYHRRIVSRTNVILGNTDPEYIGLSRDRLLAGTVGRTEMMFASARLIRAGRDLFGLVRRLGQERRRQPTNDVISRLVNANVDGESLTPQELGSFFILLVVAGNETTRTALAHALHLFTIHQDQRDLLLSNFDGHIAGAVEEILRYATPVIQFRRTVTQDCDLNGTQFHAGDKVVLFYNSANRDERVFEDPDRFDITRSPNRHRVSVAPARITAWARTWLAGKSPCCCERFSPGCRIFVRSASPRRCCRTSSTA
ncbi:cytochrome P450 [Fodinicola feengrottensis]|uniref:cytochrome P450 n=1 Tax=Fodinicola feengrottensis TaxID=435914 RepID=UPI0013D522DA|nr:cytochrome P450 [Fodinicola feengrottensis]